jgi:hypothetical protein
MLSEGFGAGCLMRLFEMAPGIAALVVVVILFLKYIKVRDTANEGLSSRTITALEENAANAEKLAASLNGNTVMLKELKDELRRQSEQLKDSL